MKERILVVEDEAIVLMDLKTRLSTLGYVIAGSAAYGEEAVRKAEETRPDIVLMDIGLKGDIDGIEAADRIRSFLNIPIVYLTANSDFNTLQRAKITEPFGYILKPFDERELRTTIEMALYKHQLDAKLNETWRWMETTLNSIGDGVVTTDVSGRITFMNPAAEILTGWKSPEALGKEVAEVLRIVDEETRQPAFSPVENARYADNLPVLSGRTALIDRSGSERPVDSSAAIIKDTKGSVIGVAFVCRDVSERRKADRALRASEANLARAQAIAQVGDWELDLKAGTMRWSGVVGGILGIPSDAPGNAADLFYASIHPEDRPLVTKQIKEIAPDRDSASFDFRIVRPDGTTRHVHDEAEITRDEHGEVVKMFGTMQDVTERRLAEEALKVSEERFFNVTNSTLDAIISINDAGTIIFWNKAAERIFGYSRYEAIGKPFTMIMPVEHHPAFLRSMEACSTDGKATLRDGVVEYMGMRMGGGIFPMEMSVSGWKEKGHSFFTAIVRDITERKRAEEALRKSEDRFAKAFNSLPGMVTITTVVDGRFVEVNDRFTRITGYTRDEVLGKTISEIGFLAPEHRDVLLIALREKGRVENMEVAFRRKSGDTGWGLLSCDFITIDDDRYVIMMMTDITSLAKPGKSRAVGEEIYRHLAGDTRDAVTVIENDEVKFANPRTQEIFGVPQDELTHRTHLDLAAPEERERVKQVIDAHEGKGKPVETTEYWIVRKDGSRRKIRNRHMVVRKDDKTVRKYVITKDITDE